MSTSDTHVRQLFRESLVQELDLDEPITQLQRRFVAEAPVLDKTPPSDSVITRTTVLMGIPLPESTTPPEIGASGIIGSPFHLPFSLELIDATHLRVYSSTLAGDLPDGFSIGDDPPFILSVTGSGVVYGEVNYDDSTGDITDRSISYGSSVPDDDDTTTYFRLGSFNTTSGAVVNDAYGPVTGNACADFFTSPLTYTLALTGTSGYTPPSP